MNDVLVGFDADILPGRLLYADNFKDNGRSGIRAFGTSGLLNPVDLSIQGGAGESSSETVSNPTKGNLLNTVNTLTKTREKLAAKVYYTSKVVQSAEELGAFLGASASIKGAWGKVGASYESAQSKAQGETLHAIKLYQSGFTVSIDDSWTHVEDALTDAGKAELASLNCEKGAPLTYVKSVNYGRFVSFLAIDKSSARFSDKSLGLAISLPTEIGQAGLGADQGAKRGKAYRAIDSTWVILGGSQSTAMEALKSGEFSKFFLAETASSMVPLSAQLFWLAEGRKQLSLYSPYTGTERACVPVDCADQAHTRTFRMNRGAGLSGRRGNHSFGLGACPRNGIRTNVRERSDTGPGSCGDPRWSDGGNQHSCDATASWHTPDWSSGHLRCQWEISWREPNANSHCRNLEDIPIDECVAQ